MVSQASARTVLRRVWQSTKTISIGIVGGLCALPLGAQLHAYEGPYFAKGMWKFERSLEVRSRNGVMPNAKHVRVDPPVTRCVDPTQAMKETFRPVSIGSCRSTHPERTKNTYRFARRCDYLGPVTTVIAVESETAYRETNEIAAGPSPKKEVVVARRIGDCTSVPVLGDLPIRAHIICIFAECVYGQVAHRHGSIAVSASTNSCGVGRL